MRRAALHSVPRSGSSWVGALLNSHPEIIYRFQPLFSHSFKGALQRNASREDIIQFYEALKSTEDPFVHQLAFNDPQKKKKAKGEILLYKEVRYHFLLENMMKMDTELTAIGLVRNPFAVLHSWLNAPREFRKDLGWEELEEWEFAEKKNKGREEEYNGYAKWKEVVLLFEKLKEKYNSRFYILNYNELLSESEEELRKLFEFLGMELNSEVLDFLASTKATNDKDSYSVYKTKSKDIDWKKGLNPIIVEKIHADLKENNLMHYAQ